MCVCRAAGAGGMCIIMLHTPPPPRPQGHPLMPCHSGSNFPKTLLYTCVFLVCEEYTDSLKNLLTLPIPHRYLVQKTGSTVRSSFCSLDSSGTDFIPTEKGAELRSFFTSGTAVVDGSER